MPHHGASSDTRDHGGKRSYGSGQRRKNNRPSYLSYLDDHDPGKTTHSQFLDEIPNTKGYRYHPKELSYLLQQNANRRDISQLSANAQHRLKGPIRICHKMSDAEKLVDEWLPILDELFFFSTVGPHLRNGIQVIDDPKSGYNGLYNEKESSIKINIAAGRPHIDERHCERFYISILLHEMVHAFIRTFSCNQKCCKVYDEEVIGHQSIWCHAMIKIVASFEKFVNWHADCNIGGSVMLDMEKSDWQPREDQLKRWGLKNKLALNFKLGEYVGFVRSEWPRSRRSPRQTIYREEDSSVDYEESDYSDSEDSEESESEEEDDHHRRNRHSHCLSSSRGHPDRPGQSSSHQDLPRRGGEGGSHRKKEPTENIISRSSHPQFLDKLPTPKPHRFHPEELGNILRRNAREQSFSHLSSRTQLLLRGRIPHCDTREEVHDLLKEWLRALDEIFYFSLVREHLAGGLLVIEDPELHRLGRYDPQARQIEINLACHNYYHGQEEESYIDTLAHEMLHAFMMDFICRKWCCWSKLLRDPDWLHCGTGHAAGWCKTMTEIEQKMSELVGWDPDCGIKDAEAFQEEDGGRTRALQIGCKPM